MFCEKLVVSGLSCTIYIMQSSLVTNKNVQIVADFGFLTSNWCNFLVFWPIFEIFTEKRDKASYFWKKNFFWFWSCSNFKIWKKLKMSKIANFQAHFGNIYRVHAWASAIQFCFETFCFRSTKSISMPIFVIWPILAAIPPFSHIFWNFSKFDKNTQNMSRCVSKIVSVITFLFFEVQLRNLWTRDTKWYTLRKKNFFFILKLKNFKKG